ncbi:TVP38/TMEM64 family protein [Intestinimonas massiliensis (ex Afouda et al. 2020)]|uniref:TVP38/TMEM64 family protein n=1 Tax=Intestinimonas massiliensis (ex Afouda et al. 2020) TaxID=1673721 RepID=UPI0010325840|nr:TVP38/TMEM64 family protein [Intestinimonas massiliensis (ex Afouda et al. 2020)]
MKRKGWLVLLAVVLLLLGSGTLLWRSGFFDALTSQQAMRDYIQRFAPYTHLCFFLIQFLSVLLAPIPSNITALAGGVLFGTWVSFLLTWAAVVLGSVLVFLLARYLGQSFVDRMVSQSVTGRYLEIIRRKQDVFLALVFLFPFFPDDLICILAGLTTIPFRRFLIIALLTRPWGLLVACALGGSALSIPLWAMALLAVGGIAVFLVCLKYGDRWENWLLERLKK